MLFGDIYDVDDVYELEISELTRKDELGNLRIHFARTPSVVTALVELGSKVNVRNNSGKTPLHYATNPDVVKKLIYYYADVDAGCNKGLTKLHTTDSTEIAWVLIEHGADVNAKDYYGRTPLHTCRTAGIARILLENDAEFLSEDNNLDPIDYHKNKIQKFVPNALTSDLLEFKRLISILSVISKEDEHLIYTDVVLTSLIRENVRLTEEIKYLSKTETKKRIKKRWF